MNNKKLLIEMLNISNISEALGVKETVVRMKVTGTLADDSLQ